jgi:hypothetical protein
MATFTPWITPLHQAWQEVSLTGWTTLYEGIPAHIDCLGPLLYELFQEHWAEIQVGHVAEGGVLELAFKKPPALCVLYDGYLTVATETWHLHLCLEEHQGGPHRKTPPELRRKRLVSRAALYRRLNPQGQPACGGSNSGMEQKNLCCRFSCPAPFWGQRKTTCRKAKQITKSFLFTSASAPSMCRGKSGSPMRITLLNVPTLLFVVPAVVILPATTNRLWKLWNRLFEKPTWTYRLSPQAAWKFANRGPWFLL